MRIICMGTPEFSIPTFEALREAGHDIVAVVTMPDKPAGRGKKLRPSPVKVYAEEHGVEILQPVKLRDPEFVARLNELKPDLAVVVAFRMLPEMVWSVPTIGTINLHAALLPDYRGAAPINWAIINGETKTGVTTFFIDDKIDTGEIILQEETSISDDETVGMLHDKLMFLGADLVLKTVDLIKTGNVTTTKQPPLEEKSAPKLYPENCKIDWSDSLDHIYNKIRGLNPFPAAWSIIKNDDDEILVKIYAVKKEREKHQHPIGKIIATKKEIKVAVKNGCIRIDEIKLASKKKMDARSLLNGFTFSTKAKMI